MPLLEALSRQMEVIAPVATEAGPVYATWQGQPLDLKTKPLSPPTEFLLPHKEVLFRYVQESGRYTFKEDEIPPRLLFAIRPCDLHAIAVLDRIFGQQPLDQAYFRRRRATALVVQNCISSGERVLLRASAGRAAGKRSLRSSAHRPWQRIFV